jgi:hypothetical protein
MDSYLENLSGARVVAKLRFVQQLHVQHHSGWRSNLTMVQSAKVCIRRFMTHLGVAWVRISNRPSNPQMSDGDLV